MYRVVVAGGIASGKSTFARELERLGALRIDLDELSREVLCTDARLIEAIANEFGNDVVDERGQVRRAELAARAFVSREAVARLEALEIPAIVRRLQTCLEEAELQNNVVCAAIEVPLLDRLDPAEIAADETVAVLAPDELRVQRAVRRGLNESDARARMANQPSSEWLREHADVVVENCGSQDDLFAIARSWWTDHERRGWRRVKRG